MERLDRIKLVKPLAGLAALLLILAAGPAFAQDAKPTADAKADNTEASADKDTDTDSDAGATTDAATTGNYELKLSGKHTVGLHQPVPAYTDFNNYNGNIKQPKSANELGAEIKSGEIKLVTDWFVDITTSAGKTTLTPRTGENAIYWNPQGFKFGLGYQYYTWGVADKKNPTDNLNARDYTTGIDADKIPALSLSAVWYPADFVSIQGVYKPAAEESIYDQDFQGTTQKGLNSYYGLVKLLTSGAVTQSGTATINEPANDTADFVAGGRAAFTLSGVDFSLSYLYDLDQFYSPVITMSNSSAGYYPSSVSLERRRIHRLGADFKTTIEKFGLWAESALNLTEDINCTDDAIRNPSVAYTVGGDVNFGPNDRYYLNLQYIGEVVFNYDASIGSDYVGGSPSKTKLTDQAYMKRFFERNMTQKLGTQTEGLTQGITTNLKLPLDDASVVNPTLTAAYVMPFNYDDTTAWRYGSLVLNPQIDIAPFDAFHIYLGSDLYYAWIQPRNGNLTLDTTGDRVGSYTNANNVYLKVEYSWNYLLKK